jgi:hypothetical protein
MRIVRGAAQRIVRAAPGSRGKDLQVTEIEYNSEYQDAEDWLNPSIARGIDKSSSSGYGRWEQVDGGIYNDQRRFPVEGIRGLTLEDEKRVANTDRETGLMSKAFVHRDPVTRSPENIAQQDAASESDNFFGSDQYPRQLDVTLERAKKIDRGSEQVDYEKSKTIPIRIL